MFGLAGYPYTMQNSSKVPKLSDYTLIGNPRAAALVYHTGAIEWCCLPYTNVVETSFETDKGAVRLPDAFTAPLNDGLGLCLYLQGCF